MAGLIERYGWHEWISHTNFSFLVGASHPREVVERAVALAYRGLAVTDYDGVYGLARSHTVLARLRQDHGAELRLMHGMELHLQRDHDQPVLHQDTIVLIATSHRGYYNLCRLASAAHRDGKAGGNVPIEQLLAAPVDDLVAIQPMRGLIRRGRIKELQGRSLRLREHFAGRLYVAVSRHLSPAEDRCIGATLDLADRLGVQCLLTNDVFMHERAQKDLSDLLHAIRLNRPVSNVTGHLFPNGERSLHELRVIEARYRGLPVYEAALKAARHLADQCCFDLSELQYHYPKEMLPEGCTAQQYLETVAWEGARARYGTVPDKLVELLNHELALIEQLGFADYFLTVWDIVRWARAQGILCQGRGSAANSAVCFMLGITAVDPSLFDLLFERFISVERGDPPDIDVDFEHERREEVIQYIYERYGRDKAAMVANVITFRSKGAVRAAGKALGIPEAVLGQAGVLLASRESRRDTCERTLAELQGDNLPWRHWGRMAERLRGFPRHLGIHSGGFMLADKPLDWLVPQEPATMPGRTVIQWSKEDIEALGFFKIDVLALGILTAIRKCLALIRQHQGRDLTLATIPQGDTATYDMICRADTVGTFQIESRAQMSMLPRLRPRCFYDLVIEVAIIRPGPIQGGMIHPFLRRRSGEEPVTFPDPRLEKVLGRTLGVPIFQEQVMRVAMEVGGFTPGEADQLRKNMGAFAIKGDISRWIGKLEAGMRQNGIGAEFVQQIMNQMQGFADYGFPESHSASFALLAYASSYLKQHHPAAFFTSLLSSQPMGFYSPHVLIQTARHCGVPVLPICVASSAWDAELERQPGGELAIRLGMRLVRSLSEPGARALVERRAAVGGWRSLEHMLRCSRISRVDLTALAAANALSVFGIERRAAIWLAEAAPFSAFLEDVEPPVAFPRETMIDRCQADFHTTTTSLGRHPAEIIRRQWCYPVPVKQVRLADQVAKTGGGTTVVVFGMVIVRQAPPSAKGMLFATLEDETGLVNLAFTPPTRERYRDLINRQAFLCVRGRLQLQHDAHSVLVSEVLAPTAPAADVAPIGSPAAALPAAVAVDAATTSLVPARNYT